MNAPPEEAEAHARVSKRENRLYVGNLSYSCTYRDLRDFMMGGALALDPGFHYHDHPRGNMEERQIQALDMAKKCMPDTIAKGTGSWRTLLGSDLVIHPDDSVMELMGRVT